MNTYDSESDEENEINVEMQYINHFLFYKTYQEELETIQDNYDNITNLIISNNLKELNKIKIILDYSDIDFHSKKSDNKSYKNRNYVWYSLYMNNRFANTIYYLLLKLIFINYRLRERCRHCISRKNDLQENEIELSKNINNILSSIGLLQCSCKFESKYYYIYRDDYFNVKHNYNVLIKYLPDILTELKTIYKIKVNIEDIKLTKPSRCIHEDIRHKNLYYCLDEKYKKLNNSDIIKVISILELVYNEYIKNIEIVKILFSSQTYYIFTYIIEHNLQKDITLQIMEIIFKKNNQFVNITNERLIKNIMSIKNISLGKVIIHYLTSYLESEVTIQVIISLLLYNAMEYYEYVYILVQTYNERKIVTKDTINILYDTLLESNLEYDKKGKILNIFYSKNIFNSEYNLVYKLSSLENGDFIYRNILDIHNTKSDNIESIIYNCIANRNHEILEFILKKYKNINNPLEYYVDIVKSIVEFKYYNVLVTICSNKKYITPKILENAINKDLFILIKYIIENTNVYYDNLIIDCIKRDNYISFESIIKKHSELIKIDEINNFIFESKYTKLFLLQFITNLQNKKVIYQSEHGEPLWYRILFNLDKNTKIGLFNKLSSYIDPLTTYKNISIILYTYLEDEYEITLELFNKLLSDKKVFKTTDNSIYSFFINETINYIPIIIKYIQNVPNNNNYNIDEFNNFYLLIVDPLIYILIITIFFLLFNDYEIKTSNYKQNIYKSNNDDNLNIEEEQYGEISTTDYNNIIETIDDTIEEYKDRKIVNLKNNLYDIDDDDIIF